MPGIRLLVLAFILLVTACRAPGPTVTPPPAPTQTPTAPPQTPTPVPSPTRTPVPARPSPTSTPVPAPTATTAPTPTSVPQVAPAPPDTWQWLSPLPQGNDLWSVWGSSPNDVFAVAAGAGTILHYDGQTWSVMQSRTPHDLYGVWGSSPSDVYAASRDGTILSDIP